MDEINQPNNIEHANNSFINKWNLVLLSFIVILVIITTGFFMFSSSKKSNTSLSFNPGTTYKGTWKTSNEPDLPVRLTIIKRENTNITVLYEWGNDVSGGHTEQNAVLQPNGTLTWTGTINKPRFTFILKNNQLKGIREEGNQTSTATLTP